MELIQNYLEQHIEDYNWYLAKINERECNVYIDLLFADVSFLCSYEKDFELSYIMENIFIQVNFINHNMRFPSLETK